MSHSARDGDRRSTAYALLDGCHCFVLASCHSCFTSVCMHPTTVWPSSLLLHLYWSACVVSGSSPKSTWQYYRQQEYPIVLAVR